jgi:hypothetical protein
MIQSAIDNKTLPPNIMEQLTQAAKGNDSGTSLQTLLTSAMDTIHKKTKELPGAGASSGSSGNSGSSAKNPILEVYGATIYEGYKKDKLIQLEEEFNNLYSKQFISGPYKVIRAYIANPQMTDDDVKKFMNPAYVPDSQNNSGTESGLSMSEIQKGAKQILKDLEKSSETTWSNMKTKKSYHIAREDDTYMIAPV